MANIIQSEKDFDDSRRSFLVKALSTGALAGGLGWNMETAAGWFGGVPTRLPDDKSIFDMKGDVRVNGKPATRDMRITAADRITTGKDSYVITAIGATAFILREKSELEVAGKQFFVRSMKLVSGAVLGVFGRRKEEDMLRLSTPIATMGIRGTGVYWESDPEKSYICTCYGTVDIASAIDTSAKVSVTATHHDAAKYVLKDKDGGERIVPAPFKNHTDQELMAIEALVGRKVPFGIQEDIYDNPRRDY